MSSNPYQSPSEGGSIPPDPNPESARSVFLAWERLRCGYNVVLVFAVLASAGSSLTVFEFWEQVFLGAFAANICFCLGPVVEGYLSLIGAPRRIARWLIFVPGTLFSCLVTVVFVVTWQIPPFD
jgi:hypothetical protein